jgi:hypothetical protein
MTDRQLNVFWLVMALLLLIWNATDAWAGQDVVEVIWECYDVGIYTMDIAQEMVHHPDVHMILPIEDSILENLCEEIYLELSE